MWIPVVGNSLGNFNLNKKIIIFGASGLIGNEIYSFLIKKNKFEVIGTSKKDNLNFRNLNLKSIESLETAKNLIIDFKPNFVINSLGITKHNADINQEGLTFLVNSIFPHFLALNSEKLNYKLIHISTDCVFDGKKNKPYMDDEIANARDIYGYSKSLGEIKDLDNVITIRTSVIGHKKEDKSGLLEWFLDQEGNCDGYSNAIFSGLSTIQLSREVFKIIQNKNFISGLFNLSNNAIDKLTLLETIAKIYKKNIKISDNSNIKVNRALNSMKYSKLFSFKKEKWEEIVYELYKSISKE